MDWQRLLTTLTLGLSLSGGSGMVRAESGCPVVAQILSWEGELSWRAAPAEAGDDAWQAGQRNLFLCAGVQLRTGVQSRAVIALTNDTLVRLAPETVLVLPSDPNTESFLLRLQKGFSRFFSRVRHPFTIETPYVNAAVSGTELVVWAMPEVNGVAVIEGVVAANQTGQPVLKVKAGQSVLAGSRSGALARVEGYGSELVDWSLYTPDVLTPLEKMAPPDSVNAQAFAEALQSAVYSAQLRRQDALQAAEQSIKRAPDQAAGYLARSIALQNLSRLDEALADALTAQAKAPDNPLAANRVTALLFFKGDLHTARRASLQAQERFPQNPQTLAYAGLLALFDRQTTAAEHWFRQAQYLDPEQPLAPMGLGLLALQRGQAGSARQHLDHALALDPNQSALRSLLGQAFFAAYQDEKALTQWELARELDPQDPTPEFYLGQLALQRNQPLQALEQFTRAHALDPGRGVMRSEALIASDQASRSAAVAQTFATLGLDAPMRQAGYRSLREDPTLSQGHRLLAESWRAESRYQSAVVSEQLQAQLWQPLSAYPLAPQWAETDLRVIEGLGPERGGLGEYHPLFLQEGVTGSINGILGPDDTAGNDAVINALQGPVNLALGQYQYRSDGFRENADQDQSLLSAQMQWQVLPETQLQMEYRELDWRWGDLGILLGDATPTGIRHRREVDTLRLGGRTALNAENTLLFSAIRQTYDELQTDAPVPGVTTRTTLAEIPESLELQHAGRFQNSQWLSGLGFLKIDRTFETETSLEVLPGVVVTDRIRQESQPTHTNAYSYLTYHPWQPLTLQWGLAWDALNPEQRSEQRQWSPKFGAIYSPQPTLDLRFAAFRTLRREMAAQQTLEPTNLAGFNQFYDDPNTADAHNLAVGLDHRPQTDWFWGVSSQVRELDFDIIQGNQPAKRYEQRQKTAETYLSHVISSQLILSARWVWEDFENDYAREAVNELSRQTAYRLPLAARLFLGAWQLTVEAEYLNQTLDFTQLNTTTLALEPTQTEQAAWIGNLGARYLLPNRVGHLELGIDNLGDVQRSFVRSDGDYLQFYPSRFSYARVQFVF